MTAVAGLLRSWDDDSRHIAEGRAAFLELYGPSRTAERARMIAGLRRVEWRGRTLVTIRCCGDFGKGPHDMNVPESLVWNLINPGRFLCPYHR